jgi:rhomboid family protein
VTVRVLVRRYGFAAAYLGCFLAVELAYSLLDPDAQARLVAWASTNVANLEHEPVGPLLASAFVAPGYSGAWPVLIALALFGANRALGNVRTALVCLAGHVVGSLVSEGIVAYRVDAGQLSAASRHLSDVGPSYVVVSAIVIALACGTWLARTLAVADLALLVFPGQIFAGLSQLDVSAVGHLTAMLTAVVATALITSRWPRRSPGPGTRSGGHLADGHADQVGDPGGAGAQEQLADGAPPERPVGQPGHDAPAGDRGDGGEPEREGHHIQAGQVRDERDDRADRERGQRGARGHHRRGQLAWIHP